MPQASNVVSFGRPQGKSEVTKFQAIRFNFDAAIGETHLRVASIASIIVNRGWREVERNCRNMLESGEMVSEVLEDLQRTRDYFAALTEVVDCATARILITLARIAPEHPSTV